MKRKENTDKIRVSRRSGSLFDDAPSIVPARLKKNMKSSDLLDLMGGTCFEARNVSHGAKLLKHMIDDGDQIWMGISGAGIAGGLGGLVAQMIELGFIDVICSTGAQIYHDLHFAFDLPVKAISPNVDDNLLREHGDTRIYDLCLRDFETLDRQDLLLQRFIMERYDILANRPLSSAEFNYQLGLWALENSKYPERSLTCTAAKHAVPLFWDSHTNHSIALSIAKMAAKGKPLDFPIHRDIHLSSAIVYGSKQTGFLELGGGGPKNFIQQTGPNLSQINKIPYKGADRGIQISVADPRDGGLSGCTFSEAVTWHKYKKADERSLIQIWGEYAVIFPMLALYALDRCAKRKPRRLYDDLDELDKKLTDSIRRY